MKTLICILLTVVLFSCQMKEDLDKISTKTIEVCDYDGVLSDFFLRDMFFENVNQPHWMNRRWIDSLKIKSIEIRELNFKESEGEKGVMSSTPNRLVSLKFSPNGDPRVIIIKDFYDEILIAHNEFKVREIRENSYASLKHILLSKFKKKLFYSSDLELKSRSYLLPLKDNDSVFAISNGAKEVLLVGPEETVIDYYVDSLKRPVIELIGSFDKPSYLVKHEEKTIDTVYAYKYNLFDNLVHLNHSSQGFDHRISVDYTENTIKTVLDSVFVLDDFVGLERYSFYYDSLKLPYQVIQEKALEHGEYEKQKAYNFSYEF